MAGTTDARNGNTPNGHLPRDLGLHYAGIPDPYRVGRAGVEDAAAFLRRIELVHRKLVYLESAHVVLRSCRS